MKSFWSLLAKLLIIVVIVQAWFLYDYYHKHQQLIAENVQLETELLKTTDALLAAENKVAEMEKRTLDHMVKETNKAVVTGWEKLLNAVTGELDKAKEAIHEMSKPEEQSVIKQSDTKQSDIEQAPSNTLSKPDELKQETITEEAAKEEAKPSENKNSINVTPSDETGVQAEQSLMQKAETMIKELKEAVPSLSSPEDAKPEENSSEIETTIPKVDDLPSVPKQESALPEIQGERT